MFNYNVTWGKFLTMAILFVVVYFVLTILLRVLSKVNLLGHYQSLFERVIRNILLVYEPLAIILLVCYFVLINPPLHGLSVAAILALGFGFFKDYFIGRVVQLDNNMYVGTRIGVGDRKGIVSRSSRTGLYLKTGKGAHFFSYSQLYKDGFTVFSGEEAGGFYHLKISPIEFDDKQNYINLLTDSLATAPYLNWNYKFEVLPNRETDGQFDVKVFVKEESHFYELVQLIKEWGYNCKTHKK